MNSSIIWTNEKRRLCDLADWPKNPRQLSRHDAEHIRRSIHKFGLAAPLVVNADGQIIGGHQRKRIMLLMEAYGEDAEVDVRVPSRQLDEDEAAELNIRLNRNVGEFDWDKLANEFDIDDMLDWGFTDFDLGMHGLGIEEVDYDELWKGMPEFEMTDDKHRSLIVHFASQDDVNDFCALVGQNLTEKTKSIWYPAKERASMKDFVFENES